MDSYKIDGYSTQDQSMLIDFIIQNSTPKKFMDTNADKDMDNVKRQLVTLLDNPSPWFSKWKKQFLQTTKFSDHELLH